MTNPKHAPNEIMPSDKMMLLNMTLAPHCDRGEPLLEALKPQVFAHDNGCVGYHNLAENSEIEKSKTRYVFPRTILRGGHPIPALIGFRP
jgi:hypothetical protein